MVKEKIKIGFLSLFLWVILCNCVNLKYVNNYASASFKAINKYDDLNYNFKQHCIERSQWNWIRNFEIKKEMEFDCGVYKTADSVTSVIYHSIHAYFYCLSNISDADLTDYNFNPLKKSLTKGNFGDMEINDDQVNAYSKISSILLKITTDVYRKNRLILFIDSANAPIQVLLSKLQFIFKKNLREELNFTKAKLYDYYTNLKMNNTLSDYEKGKATIDYYQQLTDLNKKQKQIDTFASGLYVIAEGHQQLYDNRKKMTTKELKEILKGYASDIQDIVTEFNKL